MNHVPSSNWLQRNWKWVVPAGCLSILVAFGAFALLAWGIFSLVFRMMESSDVYQQALDRARNDQALTAVIGTPMEGAFFASGEIHESGGEGGANLAIPLHGPRGNAILYVAAWRSRGVWHFSKLDASVERTKQSIDLLRDQH